MVNVIFCGYRDWALEIIKHISKHPKVNVLDLIKSNEEYQSRASSFSGDVDIILFLGWSWIIPPEVTNKYLCLGIHPSDLPKFRGGSPIQNQIVRNVTDTKVTLMTLSSEKLDAGDIWLKEDLKLTGNSVTEIFERITESSIRLLNSFFNTYPDINPVEQDISKGTYYKRRKDYESKLEIEDFQNKSLKEIYNFIRCLTDPYPNAYIEDSDGNRLVFKAIDYIEKKG